MLEKQFSITISEKDKPMEMNIGDRPRFKYKGWFAQTYYIKNDGGNDSNPNYLNRTGLIVPLDCRRLGELLLQDYFSTSRQLK